MSAVWARFRFATTGARDAWVYDQEDVDQWVEIGSARPYDLYRITDVSSTGVGTFDKVGGAGAGMTFGAVSAEVVGGSNVNGVGTDAARNDHIHALPAFGTTAGTFAQGNDSRLSDSRTPTAHATSHKSGGSDAIKLDELAAPTDITTLNVTTSAHGLAPKGTVGSTQFWRQDWTLANPPGGGSGSGSNPLYFAPSSAHADDEEFEGSNAVPSGWILRDFTANANITPSGTYDPYTLPGAGAAVIDVNTARQSWCKLQLANQNRNCVFAKKPSSIATNCLIWARVSTYAPTGGAASADGQLMLGFFADSSGNPDFQNSVCWGMRAGTGISTLTVTATVVATQGTDMSSGNIGVGDASPYDYFLIHKLGTTYHCYCFTDGGHVVHQTSFTYATSVAWIGFYIRKNSTLPLAHCFDFIRRKDTSTALPF